MANFKHKVFLLIAKWIPVAVAAGILINNTLAMLDVKDVILDLFDITVGSSLAFVIMMYACSYVFNFCYWHKIVITYDLFVLLYILLIRYTNIGELEKEIAVLRATRPYQDALIQAAIARVAEQAEFNLFRRTCRMISGEVVLPNTPTVTGYSSYDPCACRATTPAPSVN